MSPLAAAIGTTSMTDLVRLRHEQDGARHARLQDLLRHVISVDYMNRGRKEANRL